MKIKGIDMSAKYITFDLEGKSYSICFKDSFLKGVYDISVWRSNTISNILGKTEAEIKTAYPPLLERIKRVAAMIKILK